MNIKRALIICLMTFLFVAACSEQRVVSVNSHLCKSEMPFTRIEAGEYVIKIFEPNSKTNPDIWQGPLCLSHEKSGSVCGFDLSLIKSVTPDSKNKYIDVDVFSGSNSWSYRIELDSCMNMDQSNKSTGK